MNVFERTLALILCFASLLANAQVGSTFNTNDESWTAPNSLGSAITYAPTGGNPGGFVQASPTFNPASIVPPFPIYFYFMAPASLQGNFSAYYNGALTFDLQQATLTGSGVVKPEVIISNGATSIYYFPSLPFNPSPTPSWTKYTVPLSTLTGAWKSTSSSTGPTATQAEIQAVLANITAIGISGRFNIVLLPGATGMDNVTLLPAITITTQPTDQATCLGQIATLTTVATGNPLLSYHWQIFSASTGGYNDLTDTGGYTGSSTNTLSVNTAGSFGAGMYRCRVSGTSVADVFTNTVTIFINVLPNPPFTTGASKCGPGSLTLSASGGAPGQFRWYTSFIGGSPIAGETSSTFLTPSITNTTTYYVTIHNGTCESVRNSVIATINPLPTPPTVTGANACTASSLTLTASGGTTGQYRWYTVAVGGIPIAGETSSAYATPIISASTDYFVAINNGTCESSRVTVTASIVTLSKPAINSSVNPSSGIVTICSSQTVTLSTPAGFSSYSWSNGSTTSQIIVSTAGNYSVVVTDGNGCQSPTSDPVTVVTQACGSNEPPIVTSPPLSTQIEGKVTVSLIQFISDPDDNLDLTTLKIVTPPSSGAMASIDTNSNLVLNYQGIQFSGEDKLTIEVCDLVGSCTTHDISVFVAGDIIVYNGFSPNGDGQNDFFKLAYIELLDDTKDNHVTIYTRWGDVVFEVDNYDNNKNVFKGSNKSGNELATGTYFYKISFVSGKPTKTGYLTLKR